MERRFQLRPKMRLMVPKSQLEENKIGMLARIKTPLPAPMGLPRGLVKIRSHLEKIRNPLVKIRREQAKLTPRSHWIQRLKHRMEKLNRELVLKVPSLVRTVLKLIVSHPSRPQKRCKQSRQ